MEEQIKKFLSVSSGDGYGSGSGSGSGYGSGDGYGYGDGYGDGSGSGYGSGYGIKMFNGDKVYMIDNVPTIIKSIRNNIAKGFILNNDFTLEETFVVKENNNFAHGKTLHEALQSLQEKLYDDSTEEERLEAFKEHFMNFSAKYPAKELFTWHHVLTGSCKQGRESFCKNHGINLDEDMFSIDEFIKLTCNNYGGNVILKLTKVYNISP